MFASDDQVAQLLRQATEHSTAKRWGEAISALQTAQRLMYLSPVSYPAETWCRLPLYLQRAGRFEECLQAFDELLARLPERCRRDAKLDDPNVGPADGKKRFYAGLLKDGKQVIADKRALAEKRQAKGSKPAA
ncbi:MAG: hypothetical protein RL375_4564 [Pseudomonadota bacterium]|jgi:tetratricopeptide (TPR) repeat protein